MPRTHTKVEERLRWVLISTVVHTLLWVPPSLTTQALTSAHRPCCAASTGFLVAGNGQRLSLSPSASHHRRFGRAGRCGQGHNAVFTASSVVHNTPNKRCRPVLRLADTFSHDYGDSYDSMSADQTTANDKDDPQIPMDDATPRKGLGIIEDSLDDEEEFMVFTWDGDLMPSGRDYKNFEPEAFLEGSFSCLDDGEFAVKNYDGDETILFQAWKLATEASDSWDTYDSTYSDPLAFKFAELANFEVPASYDWNATTSENYRAAGGMFYGKYRHIRDRMDYQYHVNYCEGRQLLQDQIVSHWRNKGTSTDRPWIIFTAGFAFWTPHP
jgi:hypothetical protein